MSADDRRLFHLDGDCFSNIADRLGAADVVRLFQVGCTRLRERMTRGDGCVKRVNVTTDEDDCALRRCLPRHDVRGLFPRVTEIRVVQDAYNKYTSACAQEIKALPLSSLRILDAPSHWIAVSKETPLPNLHTVAIKYIRSKDPLELALPSLTSLNWCLCWSTETYPETVLPELGESIPLQMQCLIMKTTKQQPIWLQQHGHWPELQTLCTSLGDPTAQRANAHLLFTNESYPI